MNATVHILVIGAMKFSNGTMLNVVLDAPAGANLIFMSAATKRGGSFNFAGCDVLQNGTQVGTKVTSDL